MAAIDIDGNIFLIDGNAGLYMPGTFYSQQTVSYKFITQSSETLQYNTAGQHQPGAKYFDGNTELFTHANGNQPQRPFNGLTTQLTNAAVYWQSLTNLGSWADEPANIFTFKNKYGEIDLVVVYPHSGAPAKNYMLAFNDNKYRTDARYNLRWADKFMNANIPNRNAIPITTSTREPNDPLLAATILERLYMLRGNKQLYRHDGKYYTLDGAGHLAFGLASPYIYETVFEVSTGIPYLGYVPELIFYDPNAAYDTYGVNTDIPFTNNFSSIVLRRLEKSLKGPINIQGEYYWVTLLFDHNQDNILGFYTITSYRTTKLRDLPSRALLVGVEHNKDVVITTAS